MCGKKSGKIKRALGLILFSVVTETSHGASKKYVSNKTDRTMRTNLLKCNLVSISKNVVFYASLVVRIYKYLADFVNIY